MTGPKLTGLPTTPSNAALPQAAAKTAGPPAPGNPDRPSEGEAFGRLLADLDQPVAGAALRGKPLPDPPVSKVADAAQASSQPMIVRDAARNGMGLDAPSLDVDDKPAANLTPLQKALKLLASRKGPQEVSSPHPAAAAEALPSLEIAGQPINAVPRGTEHAERPAGQPAAFGPIEPWALPGNSFSDAPHALSASPELGTPARTRLNVDNIADNKVETVMVSSVRQETHLPPTAPLFTQLADAVAAHAKAASPAAAITPPTTPQPITPVAKTLTLQLQPGDLGAVDIRLRLVGDALSLQLTVGKPATLHSVARESDRLVEALGQSGYAVDSLVIRQANPTSTADQPQGRNEPDGRAGSSSNQDQQNGSSASSGGSSNPGSRQGGRRPGQPQPSLRSGIFRGTGRYL